MHRNALYTAARWLILALALAGPLVMLPQIKDFARLPKTLLVEAAVWTAAALFLAGALRERGQWRTPGILGPCLALFVGWSGLSALWAGQPVVSLVAWLHLFSCLALFLLTVNLFESQARVDRLLGIMLAVGFLVSFLGILQYISRFDWLPQVVPPSSTFGNKNLAAHFVAQTVPLALLMALAGEGRNRRIWGAACLGAMALFLLYTRTRGAWFSALVSCLAGLLWRLQMHRTAKAAGMDPGAGETTAAEVSKPAQKGKKSKKGRKRPKDREAGKKPRRGWGWAVAAAVLLAALVAGLSQLPTHIALDPGQGRVQRLNPVHELAKLLRPATERGGSGIRLVMWQNTLGMIAANPLLGVGYANWYLQYPRFNSYLADDPEFGNRLQPRYAHNEFIQITAETSPIGLALALASLVAAAVLAVKGWRAGKRDDWQGAALFFSGLSGAAFALSCMFTFPLREGIMPAYLALNLGVMSSLALARNPGLGREIRPAPWLAGGLLLLALAGLGASLWLGQARLSANRDQVLAQNLGSRNRWAEAVESARRAAEAEWWMHETWFRLGQALQKSGDPEGSALAYKRALAVHPLHINSMLNLGAALADLDRLDEAVEVTRRIVPLKPDWDQYLMNMAILAERTGGLEEAADLYLAFYRQHPRETMALLRRCTILLEAGNSKKALNCLTYLDGISTAPPQTPFYLGLALEKTGHPDEAAKKYELSAARGVMRAQSLNQLGLLTLAGGQPERAVEYLRQAQKEDPEQAYLHINLAVALMRTGDLEGARREAEAARRAGLPQAESILRQLEAPPGKVSR